MTAHRWRKCQVSNYGCGILLRGARNQLRCEPTWHHELLLIACDKGLKVGPPDDGRPVLRNISAARVLGTQVLDREEQPSVGAILSLLTQSDTLPADRCSCLNGTGTPERTPRTRAPGFSWTGHPSVGSPDWSTPPAHPIPRANSGSSGNGIKFSGVMEASSPQPLSSAEESACPGRNSSLGLTQVRVQQIGPNLEAFALPGLRDEGSGELIWNRNEDLVPED